MKKFKYRVVCCSFNGDISEYESSSRNVRRHFLDAYKIYNFDVRDVKVFSRNNDLLSQAQLIDGVLLVGTPFHVN